MTHVYANAAADTMPGAPGPGRPQRGGRSRRRVATLVVACALVAGGGTFAVTEALSGPGPGAPAGTSTAAPPAASGLTGQAAVLNAVLASASPAAPPATRLRQAERQVALSRLRRALARLHLLGGMYGQYTFETKKGPRTLAFERGTISKVAGDDVMVRANDGTTWTWVLTGASVVREDGMRAPATALAVGQRVFVGGKVSGLTRDARLIVVRAAAKVQ